MEKLKWLANELTKKCSYRDMPEELADFAKENDIIIVCGYSDDLCELYGAVRDEFGCFDGGMSYIDKNGNLLDVPTKDGEFFIKALWCKSEYTWSYETNIPHENFEMLDDDEKYCLGFVFYKSSLSHRIKRNRGETMEHKIKIRKEYFEEVLNGNKKAELRFNDRGYEVGDACVLREIDDNGEYTGREIEVLITHLLEGYDGLKEGWCVFSFKVLKSIAKEFEVDIPKKQEKAKELLEAEYGCNR